MSRLPRLIASGYPHHLIHRGNNGQTVFLDDEDRCRLLSLLAEHAPREQVAVHAYVLMPDQFQLLLTPATRDGLPRVMQALSRRYVQSFNRRHARRGTLWDGRYRSTVLQADRHLLECMVYMDRCPVRGGLTGSAADYPWSSHAQYVGGSPNTHPDTHLARPHEYWQLGNTPFERESAYAKRVANGLSPARQRTLLNATLTGWVLGTTEFARQLQDRTGRRTLRGHPGRPRRGSTPPASRHGQD